MGKDTHGCWEILRERISKRMEIVGSDVEERENDVSSVGKERENGKG